MLKHATSTTFLRSVRPRGICSWPVSCLELIALVLAGLVASFLGTIWFFVCTGDTWSSSPFTIGSTTPATLFAALRKAAAGTSQLTAGAGSPPSCTYPAAHTQLQLPMCSSPCADPELQTPSIRRLGGIYWVLQLGFCSCGFAPKTGEVAGHGLSLQLLVQPFLGQVSLCYMPSSAPRDTRPMAQTCKDASK